MRFRNMNPAVRPSPLVQMLVGSTWTSSLNQVFWVLRHENDSCGSMLVKVSDLLLAAFTWFVFIRRTACQNGLFHCFTLKDFWRFLVRGVHRYCPHLTIQWRMWRTRFLINSWVLALLFFWVIESSVQLWNGTQSDIRAHRFLKTQLHSADRKNPHKAVVGAYFQQCDVQVWLLSVDASGLQEKWVIVSCSQWVTASSSLLPPRCSAFSHDPPLFDPVRGGRL